VARALVKRPALILADEPTANLDQATGHELIALMRRIQRTTGATFIFSSHDPKLMQEADLRVRLVDGKITEISGNAMHKEPA
jgi:putative ABC transport system ATP-binding protein